MGEHKMGGPSFVKSDDLASPELHEDDKSPISLSSCSSSGDISSEEGDAVLAWGCSLEEHRNLRVYTWEELDSANTPEHCLLVIHRHVYDVTSYLQNHPGGADRLVNAAGGKDVTWLFESSHPLFVGKTILHKYLVGHIESEERDPAIRFNDTSPFYHALKERVEAYLKLKRVRPNRCAESYFRISSVYVLCIWLFFCTHYFTTSLLGGVLSALFNGLVYTQLFLLGHESTHGSLSQYPWLNKLLSYSWDLMSHAHLVEEQLHSMAHHLYVGAGSYDPDDDWIPFGLIRARDTEEWKWFHQYQHLYCWPLYGLFSFVRYFNQFKIPFDGSFRRFKLNPMSTSKLIQFYVSKIIFVLYMFVLPMYFQPWWRALLLSGIVMYVNGWLLCSFTYYPHTVKLDERRITRGCIQDEDDLDWAKFQVKNSVSYGRRDSIKYWFMSGWENFHAEHHLFPYMNPVWCRMISPIVKRTCAEYGVQYMSCETFREFFGGQYRYWKELGKKPKSV